MVRIKSLIVENVVPSLEELKFFDLAKNNEDNGDGNLIYHNDLENLENNLKNVTINKTKKFSFFLLPLYFDFSQPVFYVFL